MTDKNEKEPRRKIKNELRKKAHEEFEKNLPMSRELFQSLFDYLDEKLTNSDCDNTLKMTMFFLVEKSGINTDNVIEWLQDNGGNCDCEVLANVEEMFEH